MEAMTDQERSRTALAEVAIGAAALLAAHLISVYPVNLICLIVGAIMTVYGLLTALHLR